MLQNDYSKRNRCIFRNLKFLLVYTLDLRQDFDSCSNNDRYHPNADSYNPSDERYHPNDRLGHSNADSYNARDKRNHSMDRRIIGKDRPNDESSSMSSPVSSTIDDQTIDQSPPRYGWARMLAHHNFRKATTLRLLPYRITSHWRFYASRHTICHRRANLSY